MQIYSITKKREFEKAHNDDFIQMIAASATETPVTIQKSKLVVATLAIISGEVLHLSGATGTGKTSFLNALLFEPRNWKYMCQNLNLPHYPIRVFSHSAVGLETPSELFYRRSINEKGTFDEMSDLLKDMKKLQRNNDKYYNVIWISEMLRMPSNVQSAFVELINQKVFDSKGKVIGVKKLAWLFDSNYQAAQDENFFFELSQFDEAFKARNTVCLTFEYLNIFQEVGILKKLLKEQFQKDFSEILLFKVVEVSAKIREEKLKGKFPSLPMPTFRQYLGFFNLANANKLTEEILFDVTIFGFATKEDHTALEDIYQEIYNKYEREEEHVWETSNKF